MSITLTPAELHLILEIRNLRHGEIHVRVQDGRFSAAQTIHKWDRKLLDQERPPMTSAAQGSGKTNKNP